MMAKKRGLSPTHQRDPIAVTGPPASAGLRDACFTELHGTAVVGLALDVVTLLFEPQGPFGKETSLKKQFLNGFYNERDHVI